MHKVEHLLAAKQTEKVVWIEPLASVYEALQLMHDENIGALLVNVDEYLVGIVSERDYARHVILNKAASEHTRVSEIMTHGPITVSPEDTVVHCIALMRKHHIRHLPVIVAGRPVGMVSLRDLFLDVIHEKLETLGVAEEEI